MKFNHMAVLRETLARMSTAQLEDMLREELRKAQPDGTLVRLIGSVLQERDGETPPQLSPGVRAAWEDYLQKNQAPPPRTLRFRSRLVKAASLILVLLAFLLLLPREASAKNFFERVIAWTEDVFSLISPGEKQASAGEYVFRTDNPGLQEVYDQVTALGVTTPVVPMWLPEGYELVECMVTETPTKSYMTATFFNGVSKAVFQVDVYSGNISSSYSKDETNIQLIEKNGIAHTVMYNKAFWVVVWTRDNIECTIVIDCQEDALHSILGSIYTMEDSR